MSLETKLRLKMEDAWEKKIRKMAFVGISRSAAKEEWIMEETEKLKDPLLKAAIDAYKFGRPSNEQVALILKQCESIQILNSWQDTNSYLERERSSVLDCTMGVALGDAMGLGIENERGTRIEEMFEIIGKYLTTRSGKYAINFAPGYGSDDTEQHIAVMICLIEHGPLFSQEQLSQCFLNEYEKNRNYFGISTQGHGSIRPFLESGNQKDLEKAQDEQRVRYEKSGSCGNGVLMRALPLSFIEDKEKRLTASETNALATHPCPISILCSVVLVEIAHEIKIETRNFVFQRANEIMVQLFSKRYPDVVEKVGAYFKNLDEIEWNFNDWKLSGLERIPEGIRFLICNNDEGVKYDALTTLGAVFFGLKHTKSVNHLVAFCLKIGVDVDSVTAIALGIFGKIGELTFDTKKGGLHESYLGKLKSFTEVIQVSNLFEQNFLKSKSSL